MVNEGYARKESLVEQLAIARRTVAEGPLWLRSRAEELKSARANRQRAAAPSEADPSKE